MLQSLFVAVHNFPTEVRVEVGWVTKYLQETANTFFGIVLRLLLHVDRLVGFVQVRENLVNKFKQFKWRLIVEFDHTKVLHEGWSVQPVYNLLDFSSVEVGCLAKKLGSFTLSSKSVYRSVIRSSDGCLLTESLELLHLYI